MLSVAVLLTTAQSQKGPPKDMFEEAMAIKDEELNRIMGDFVFKDQTPEQFALQFKTCVAM